MKKILLASVALMLSAVAVGQNRSKMNLSTLRFLKEQQSEVKRMSQQESEAERQYVDCFIRYSQPCEEALEALGVKVMLDVDGIMTARVPVVAMDDVTNLDAVTSLNISEKMNLDSDVARAATHVFEVQKGKENGLPLNYDGTGVVLGMIDGGVDFTHPALRTADGHSRISAAYFPGRKPQPGTPAVMVNGKEIPGVAYVNKSDIDTLTTDLIGETHGTHVLGIAAGRDIGPYGGVAQGAELVVCPLGVNNEDINIMNAIAFMIDYAKKAGKPLVMNKSMGKILGPHDGTSDFVQMQDKLLGEDAIFCNSSGNAGAVECYVRMDGTNVYPYNQLNYHAVMALPWNSVAKKNEKVGIEAQVWCEDDKPFDLAFVQWDDINGFFVHKVVKYEDFYENGSASVTITNLEAGYIMEVSGMVNAANKKFNANLSWLYMTNYQVPSSSVGVMLLPRDKNQVMHMWLNPEYGYLVTNKNLNSWDVLFHEGSTSISTNDQCSSTKMISVGNFVTRVDYPVWLGTQTTTEKYENPVGSISISSSYGTTLNGVKSPTVCAPGAMIVSSVSHFDKNYKDEQSAQKQTVNGTDYYWATLSGTSMSTPHATGIIALWLQANPRMTRKDILDVMAKTSIPCDKPQEQERWGLYGKIDALAGLKYVLQTSDIRNMEAEEALLWTDVYNLNGQLIRKRVATESALEGLPAGIYVAGGRKVVVKK